MDIWKKKNFGQMNRRGAEDRVGELKISYMLQLLSSEFEFCLPLFRAVCYLTTFDYSLQPETRSISSTYYRGLHHFAKIQYIGHIKVKDK